MAFVNYGEDYGKVCVIVDFVDVNRVLVDGPTTNFPRITYPINRLSLTKLRMPMLRGARTGTVKKACDAYELTKKWEETNLAKKFAIRAKRASLTDFDRFSVMINRKNKAFKLKVLTKMMSSTGKKAAPKKGDAKAAPKGGKGKGKK